ncbi:dihydrodiol dehydrogenase [Seminavis robusta]|uniref:Dihydrodiol dehydrogenase n=1 Tax=Seminavis robusta TaxID=568900 RepID=A0A9N8DDJ0_9STRA|nr:dihydrodiol dehydrogenase [Seminavis robusta]|eukprot:Sro104_g052900.1 dihydrodiol dehydrogenase (506) ;mRNA; f:71712-73344
MPISDVGILRKILSEKENEMTWVDAIIKPITVLWLGKVSHNHILLPRSSFCSKAVVFSPPVVKMPPNLKFLQDAGSLTAAVTLAEVLEHPRIRVAILGCGMMGQEHVSYICGYPKDLRIDYLADPFQPSLDAAKKVLSEFRDRVQGNGSDEDQCHQPMFLQTEDELFQHVDNIDLLVIATPNYLHADSLIKWGKQDIAILCEKPVAVSQDQINRLHELTHHPEFRARVWTAMEYRYMPAIAKLLSLVPSTIGDLKMITIRENRYPFLHKVQEWNRDPAKTGDTLVEKCCHFFDLFRLITGQEVKLPEVRALAQRGLNYHEETPVFGVDRPIIDSAYVVMPFDGGNQTKENTNPEDQSKTVGTIGCLELCMYCEGSRHQEEIIVTGTKGRLEAYLPENKVFSFERPSMELWDDRSIPPPPSSVRRQVFDCSDAKEIHGIEDEIPTHGGYHYSSTAVEWYRLLGAMRHHSKTGTFLPEVSLQDGMAAVQIGLQASTAIVNEQQGGEK